jgi:HSP20 family protein
MSNQTLFDPFREVSMLHDAMSDFALGSFLDRRWTGVTESAMALNMRDEDDAVTVEVALPGFEDKDIEVRVEGNLLTITAHREDQHEEKDGDRWVIREHRMGQVQRSVALPASVKGERADADLKNGILTIRLPKTEDSLIRKIAVKAKNILPGKAG